MRRARVACALSVAALAVALLAPVGATERPADLPPNVILLVTDDQPLDTMTGTPVGMPWLAAQLADRVIVLTERPGRICDEMEIALRRPRQITDPEVVQAIHHILTVLGIERETKTETAGTVPTVPERY